MTEILDRIRDWAKRGATGCLSPEQSEEVTYALDQAERAASREASTRAQLAQARLDLDRARARVRELEAAIAARPPAPPPARAPERDAVLLDELLDILTPALEAPAA